MAREVKIPGTEATAKIRNLWAVALLPFITLPNAVWEKAGLAVEGTSDGA